MKTNKHITTFKDPELATSPDDLSAPLAQHIQQQPAPMRTAPALVSPRNDRHCGISNHRRAPRELKRNDTPFPGSEIATIVTQPSRSLPPLRRQDTPCPTSKSRDTILPWAREESGDDSKIAERMGEAVIATKNYVADAVGAAGSYLGLRTTEDREEEEEERARGEADPNPVTSTGPFLGMPHYEAPKEGAKGIAGRIEGTLTSVKESILALTAECDTEDEEARDMQPPIVMDGMLFAEDSLKTPEHFIPTEEDTSGVEKRGTWSARKASMGLEDYDSDRCHTPDPLDDIAPYGLV